MNRKKKIRKLKKRVGKLEKVLSAYAAERIKNSPTYASGFDYAKAIRRYEESLYSTGKDSKPPIST